MYCDLGIMVAIFKMNGFLVWYCWGVKLLNRESIDMTKSDIVDIISSSVGLTKVETEAVVNGFMETVIDAMKRGENIELRGFGSFKVVQRAQRVARNPKTNVEVIVPEQYVPVLKISKDFKIAVNKSLSAKKDV